MGNVFRFKQFDVGQNGCAMKVNTDGVLLGAWADTTNAGHILDIGTGTGVIALMMAQKNKVACVDAIDIDPDACYQANENFQNSLWRSRLNVFQTALQCFKESKKYDLIISNPPYFIDDFKTNNTGRNIARHSTGLSYRELLSGINHLLCATGKAFLVIPVFNLGILQSIANSENLFIVNQAEVIAVIGKQPYLVLLQMERSQKTYSKGIIEIQDAAGNFTDKYKLLTSDFYLKF